MKKRFGIRRTVASILALVMAFGAMGTAAFAKEVQTTDFSPVVEEAMHAAETNGLKQWYTKPAVDWASTGLVTGNGYMGTVLFGDVAKDRIHLNEKEMWSGGRKQGSEDLLFGNRAQAASKETIAQIQADLEAKEYNNDGGNLNPMFAPGNTKGAYLDFGDVYVDFAPSGHTFAASEDYVRSLDLNTAVSEVSYTVDGVDYTRNYFSSYPDKVQVFRYDASEAGKLSFDVSMTGSQGGTVVAEGDTLTLSGALRDNGLRFESQVKVVAEGGAVTVNGNKLEVRDADSVTLYQTSDTDYKNEYPTYRTGVAPHEDVTAVIANAAAKGYEAVLNDHVEDHYGLMSRVDVNIGQKPSELPTDQMMANYRQNKYDPMAEVLVYQFGRYLTIAGSRPGTLPTNLNGTWCVGNADWSGDYHFNINVQMNYWPTYVSNLAECGTSFVEYVDSLRVQGRITAGQSHGVPSADGEENGWVVHTGSGIFGGTSPYSSQEWGWNMGGAAWALQAVYDYYRFTGDVDYLKENIYPAMREQAKFWDAYLIRSPKQGNRLVVSPGVSPEQGPTSIGVTYDQALVWQLYKEAAEAAEILGVDEDLRAGWLEKMEELDPIQIGLDGQVKEWYDEGHIGQMGNGARIYNWNAGGADVHRHLSHLVSLYPGTLINKDTTEWMDAAKVSLEHRGFEITTSWSKGHRLCTWARTMEGNKAYRMVQAFLTQGNRGIMDNLLSSHGAHGGHLSNASRIFQIDGNYGYAAGFAEMLLQSQLGYIQPLPAIPDAWGTGSVKGLLARGNFACDMDWANNALTTMTVTSNIGGDCVIEYPGITEATVVDASGNAVAFETVAENRISFATTEGGVYTITTANAAAADVAVPANAGAYMIANDKTELTWSPVEGATEYVVYREVLKTVPSGQSSGSRYGEGFEEIGTTDTISFVDTDDNGGAMVYYMVAAKADDVTGGACLPVLAEDIGLAEAIADAEAVVEKLVGDELAALRTELQNKIDTLKNMNTETPIEDRVAARDELIAYTEKCMVVMDLPGQIAAAQELLDKQELGEEEWRCPKDLYDALANAIQNGKDVLADAENATAESVDAAIDEMKDAMKKVEAAASRLTVKIEKTGTRITMAPTIFDARFEIRYTTDGSEVTAESTLYTGPMMMTQLGSIALRAQIYLDGKPVGNPGELSVGGGDNLALNKPTTTTNAGWGATYAASKATDGNMNTRWATRGKISDLVIDLEEEISLNSVVLYEATGEGCGHRVRGFKIYVSNDKDNWTEVYSTDDAQEVHTCELPAGTSGRYVKYETTACTNEVTFSEIEVYGGGAVELLPVESIVLDAEAIALRVGKTATLTATVLPAELTKPYIEWTSSDEAVATVVNGVVTAVGAGEAVITADCGGKTATCTVTVNPEITDVTMVVTGEDKITVDDETVSFTVSAKDAVDLVTATVELTVDTKTMGEPELVMADGWFVIIQTYVDGKLSAIVGNNAGVTADEAELFTVVCKTTGERGNASVTLTDVTLSAYLDDGTETFVNVILGDEATASTEVTYSIYDVNRDGKVEQLDITRAQRYYGTADEICDVNGDGQVNIADLILIMNHFEA